MTRNEAVVPETRMLLAQAWPASPAGAAWPIFGRTAFAPTDRRRARRPLRRHAR